MLHLQTALETSSRTDIEDRLTGRFYTPLPVAKELIRSSGVVGCPETICDPFCGDGRLVVAWMRYLAEHFDLQRLKRVSLWDFDGCAVERARCNVRAELRRLGADWVVIDARVGDTFSQHLSEKFDLVVTNPPWEQLKPDARDLVAEASRYRAEIQSYGAHLRMLYPSASSSRQRSIGGYTVNLARAGALAAAKLTNNNGILQIVLPLTILSDQVSHNFRAEFFSNVRIINLDVYPAEAKLFVGVDQSFVALTARGGESSSNFTIRRFNADVSTLDQREHTLKSLEAPLPLAVGGAQIEITEWLRREHLEMSYLESELNYGLKLGRELDETRIGEAFTCPSRGVPFVKGRNISRFGNLPEDLPSVDPALRKIPTSSSHRRVAWRDVSRPSQKRRVHACIIPSGFVTGNSVGIARFSSPKPDLLETLMAVMNSFVFELQVRSALGTNHVSQGVIRKCVIPFSLFEDDRQRADITRCIDNSTEEGRAWLDVQIAKAYRLSRDQFATLLKGFQKLPPREVNVLLHKDTWR